MSISWYLVILIISIIICFCSVLWYNKEKSWESIIAILTSMSGSVYIFSQILNFNSQVSQDVVINSSTINNYYPVSRDTVLYSSRVINRHILDTIYIRDTTFIGNTSASKDTTNYDIEELEIFSERFVIFMPQETSLKIEASSFISIANPPKTPILFSYSPTSAKSDSLFDCNSIGVNKIKIYAFMFGKKIKELNADLDLRDPADLCMANTHRKLKK